MQNEQKEKYNAKYVDSWLTREKERGVKIIFTKWPLPWRINFWQPIRLFLLELLWSCENYKAEYNPKVRVNAIPSLGMIRKIKYIHYQTCAQGSIDGYSSDCYYDFPNKTSSKIVKTLNWTLRGRLRIHYSMTLRSNCCYLQEVLALRFLVIQALL